MYKKSKWGIWKWFIKFEKLYKTGFNNFKYSEIMWSRNRSCDSCNKNKYGFFQSSKETFQILEKNNIISKELSKNLQGMVGFRNIAVHDYQAISLDILQKIIENHLEDALD